MRIDFNAPALVRFVMVIVAWLLMPAASHAADVAAVVVDFKGSVARFSKGARSDLKLGSNLFAGDDVILAPGASLTLRSVGHCLVITEGAEAPPSSQACERISASAYRVEAKGFAGALTDRFAALSDVLGWWDPEATRKPMRSRDAYEPEILALKDSKLAPVVAGKRELQVRWVDGAPPFALSLEGPDGNLTAKLVAGDARRATISTTIKPGTEYQLVLKDATRTTRYALRGIAPGEAKDLPSAKIDPLEQAAGLLGAISDSNGTWAFEALQRIYTLPLEPRMKTALTDAIELGDWP